jgi:hypothetical protein
MWRALACIVGLIGLTFAASAFATPLRAGSPSVSYHFVEFRARDGLSGHTYVVYGKTDRRGRILMARAAGFFPSGALAESALTVFLPFPGQVGLQPADRRDPPSAIYRLYLDADAYARVVATVERFRKSKRAWHLLVFNCNAFVARVAQSFGLRVPTSLVLPNEFIRDLYLLNRPRHAGLVRIGHGSKRQ